MTVARLRTKYEMLRGVLNERTRRLWAATEATQSASAASAGWSRHGIELAHCGEGIGELAEQRESGTALSPERIRRPGGGDKHLRDKDPTLLSDLDALVEPATRGDPESPLRWTCKSTRKLAEEW